MERRLTVAIDGPAGAGKSTVARRVARAMGYLYVDTGAMYRALTWKILQQQVSLQDTDQIVAAVAASRVELRMGRGEQRIMLDGEDVTDYLRLPEVSRAVSRVAGIPEVRRELVQLQQEVAAGGGVVMDGRDIGTVILPDADVKVFLTADLEERAKRRQADLVREGHPASLEEVQAGLRLRDQQDSERATAPLRQAPDAVLIETSRMALDQVVAEVLALCRKKGGDSSTESAGMFSS